VLLFDPLKMSKGEIWLKAYRLTDSFLELYSNQTFTQQHLIKSKQSFTNIFEEVPIEIKNSVLVNQFLAELQKRGKWVNEKYASDFEKLDLSINPFLEKNMEFLIESVDELNVEQRQLQYYHRKKFQKKKEGATEDQKGELSYLDSLLLTSQINNYCTQVNEFAEESFYKLGILRGAKNIKNTNK